MVAQPGSLSGSTWRPEELESRIAQLRGSPRKGVKRLRRVDARLLMDAIADGNFISRR
jgi:hypothetical protein